MKYKIGEKVKLIHTGDIAVIEEVIGNGYYNVRLQRENYSIPVTDDDLGHITYTAAVSTPTKNTYKSKKRSGFTRFEKSILSITDSGVFLIFMPEYDENETLKHYQLGIFNDLNKKVAFNLDITTKEAFKFNNSDIVKPYNVVLFGTVPYDIFNMSAEFIFTLWESTTEGNINCRSHRIKPKPKSLVKNNKKLFDFDVPVYLFEVIKSFAVQNSNRGTGEDLSSYTEKIISSKKKEVKKKEVTYYRYDTYSVWDFAEFPREIDLHMEKLDPSFFKKKNAIEIFEIQLKHFENYIAKAIEMGIDKVFIIHGVGRSKLKKKIALELAENKNIVSFKNEYHPNYGYGATEVIIKE